MFELCTIYFHSEPEDFGILEVLKLEQILEILSEKNIDFWEESKFLGKYSFQ